MLERTAGKKLAKLAEVDISADTPEAQEKKELRRLYGPYASTTLTTRGPISCKTWRPSVAS